MNTTDLSWQCKPQSTVAGITPSAMPGRPLRKMAEPGAAEHR
ncbi:hypothetical protein [Variovorax sp. Root318D1]|nr:hypothetical protein [Variovorax sp. Root318D1]